MWCAGESGAICQQQTHTKLELRPHWFNPLLRTHTSEWYNFPLDGGSDNKIDPKQNRAQATKRTGRDEPNTSKSHNRRTSNGGWHGPKGVHSLHSSPSVLVIARQRSAQHRPSLAADAAKDACLARLEQRQEQYGSDWDSSGSHRRGRHSDSDDDTASASSGNSAVCNLRGSSKGHRLDRTYFDRDTYM